MKHSTILSISLLCFTPQINAIDYSKEIKKEFNETASTVIGKFEKNAYTLRKDYQKCSTSLIPALCYKLVLADIEKEQAKNCQAIRNIIIADIGIGAVKIAATALSSLVLPQNGSQAVNTAIGAAQMPVNTSFLTVGTDYLALWVLESNIREEMTK
ncbi:MAG: hypothetical protein NTZ68_02830 [Candidatus Dependentiae bacterium]|nr:hypothetical protein [Candidatus Dependentiae bacterium]